MKKPADIRTMVYVSVAFLLGAGLGTTLGAARIEAAKDEQVSGPAMAGYVNVNRADAQAFDEILAAMREQTRLLERNGRIIEEIKEKTHEK